MVSKDRCTLSALVPERGSREENEVCVFTSVSRAGAGINLLFTRFPLSQSHSGLELRPVTGLAAVYRTISRFSTLIAIKEKPFT